ncbi:conserved hypothetical protein [Theileria equi strain WA]|uniref:Uncharacterized protein n=1 Tax=Theileria equi strain WA TaxID=1537102 RepID=L1L9L0_THEEQ|nr:conserved hypothetical protein [Theileria equi strain WA]EKX72107.1 conserved hypothetical protein [Theileria equi strain WA]|eukprot:XP_004831559.1 conserved hypothetical protein [Theileria equi strain WA]
MDVTLDLSKPDQPSVHRKNMQEWDGVSYVLYYPIYGSTVVQLNYADQILWRKRRPEEKLMNFNFYYLYGRPTVGFIQIYDGTKYTTYKLKMNQTGWILISCQLYERLLENTKRNREIDIDEPINENVFRVQQYSPFGIPAVICTPISDYILKAVKVGEHSLWEAKMEAERCEHLVIHGPRNEPKLVHIFITLDNLQRIIYFAKDGDRWMRVTKHTFYNRLWSIKTEPMPACGRTPSSGGSWDHSYSAKAI